MLQSCPNYLLPTKLTLSVTLENNGIGVNLLKVGSKRRRTKTEINDEKEEARIKEQQINHKMQQYDQLQQQLNEMQQHMGEADQLKGFFQDMISKGKLIRDDQGNIDVPE